MYRRFVKRCLDFFFALIALLILLLPLLVLTVLTAIKMRGNPFFVQPRPGYREKIFYLIKFRSMRNTRDAQGNLLPDEERLTSYGRFLRSTSLDELPELLNILKGDMSFIGPRPQLVRDMVFMTPEQRVRHSARPGMSGLAQVSGRNALKWENKLELDLKYISEISFCMDCRLCFETVKLMLCGPESAEEVEIAMDFGDYLLEKGEVDEETYARRQEEARELLGV